MTDLPVFISDGSTASYYELPPWARELADLIRYKKMNGSQAEMFRAIYRGSEASHSDEKRQAKKLLAYAVDEVVRTHFPEESFAQYRNDAFEAIFSDAFADTKKDAARLRWLLEDHDNSDMRERCRELLERLPLMSYSAATTAIDAVISSDGLFPLGDRALIFGWRCSEA